MRRLLDISLLLVGLSVVLAGCGVEEPGALENASTVAASFSSSDVPGGESSVAILTATATNDRSGTLRRRSQLGLRALFVAHGDTERSALFDLLDLPPLLDLGATDRCVLHTERANELTAGWVDLLDAGAVDFVSGDRRYALEVQEFPDVLPEIGGVTYAGSARRSVMAAEAAGGPFVRFEGAGSGEVGPFSVDVGLPTPTRIRFVDGRAAVRGEVDVAAEGDLLVRWDARGTRDAPVLLELSRSSFGARDVLRCVVYDDGSFVIPGEMRAQLPEHTSPATEKLSLRRVADAEFYAPGVDEGWAFVISEDFVLLK